MMTPPDTPGTPDISFIMPCYNEQDIIGYTIPKMIAAFASAGHHLELIVVDNGSTDKTADVIATLASEHPRIVLHTVRHNEGYGNGVLSALPRCTAPWVGIIPADGQVDAEDVVRLYETVATAGRPILAKVRRRFRMDGVLRKVVSTAYNLFVKLLWPRLDSIDINGSPKILPREAIMAMGLQSKDWLLDPEIMIKAYYMGLPVLEFNVFGRMRSAGLSHVRLTTAWHFLRQLLVFRFSRQWRATAVRVPSPARPIS